MDDPWASDGWQAYVKDPDGNRIELTQRTAPILKKKSG
jgi:predicted enzyme related to lactoylglutathione lyase